MIENIQEERKNNSIKINEENQNTNRFIEENKSLKLKIKFKPFKEKNVCYRINIYF